MKKIFPVLMVLLLLSCLVACNELTHDDESGISSECAAQYPWRLKCSTETRNFRSDNVKITISLGGGFSDESLERGRYLLFDEVTLAIESIYQGHTYDVVFVKTFPRSEIIEKTYVDEIVVPKRIFSRKAGCIRVVASAEFSEEGKSSQLAGAGFYYKKWDNTILLAQSQFEEEYRDDTLHMSASGPASSDPLLTDYMLLEDGNAKVDYGDVEYTGWKPENLSVEIRFGHLPSVQRDLEYAELFFVTEDETGARQKRLIRRLDDYSSTDYDCEKITDYYGEFVRVIVPHAEKHKVPVDLTTGEDHKIGVALYGYTSEGGCYFICGRAFAYRVSSSLGERMISFDELSLYSTITEANLFSGAYYVGENPKK